MNHQQFNIFQNASQVLFFKEDLEKSPSIAVKQFAIGKHLEILKLKKVVEVGLLQLKGEITHQFGDRPRLRRNVAELS